jgi:preprotein translocase subunit SecE
MELKKVIWPDKQETISTSSAVLLLVVVMAFFLGAVDLVLTKIIAAILS